MGESVDSDSIAGYLQQHPEFFEKYADLLSQIYIPHPHGGRAIALADRQVLTLRDRNKILEARYQELYDSHKALLELGEENDVKGDKMHRLGLVLLLAQGLDTLLGTLYFNLREDFAFPHVALRVWNLKYDGSESSLASDEVKEYAASLADPYCGPSNNQEIAGWFGDAAGHVRSVAFMPLRESGAAGAEGACIGMLALGSEDVMRFYPEMGTLYLKRLGELASAALARYL
jgi:uncharacterized protein YigA (DUF484 family)